jgi:hypothetical protein
VAGDVGLRSPDVEPERGGLLQRLRDVGRHHHHGLADREHRPHRHAATLPEGEPVQKIARSLQRWELVGGTTPPTTPPPGGGPDLTSFGLLRNFLFGSGAGRTVTNLSTNFNPYGIAGTAVINNEWQRYQPFNGTNHRVTTDRLELTALAYRGGVYNGGWVKCPTVTPTNPVTICHPTNG